MAPYRPPEGRQTMETTRPAPFQRRTDRDDRFYDDHRSRSRSRDRRYVSPPRRRTSAHDLSRSPPRGPATNDEREYNRKERGWGRGDRQQHDQGFNSRDRSSPSPRRGRGFYRDRDREGYRSSSYQSRSRSRSSREARPRRFTAPPNKEIMMEGLAIDMTEEDITLELKQHYQVEGLTDIRVIRDRNSRQSRQFGFLRFSLLPQAESFMERNHPLLYLYGNPDLNREQPAKVHIVYSRERNEAIQDGAEGEWICKVCSVKNYAARIRCFRCQAFRADAPSHVTPKAVNVGDNDASPDNTPSQFLLLRGLEASVSEELLIKGVAKLYKPSTANYSTSQQQANKKGAKVASTTGAANLGAQVGTLRRVLLVKDRRTNESWRFGFAEFATVEDAMAALIRYNTFDKFTIASKPVLVSYVHSGVFVPVLNPGAVDPRFTFAPLANPSMKIAYWDDEAFVAEFKVDAGETEAGNSKVKQQDVTRAVADLKDNKSKKRKAEPTAMDISTAKKATPTYLQRWSNQHAELHGLQPKPLSTRGEGDSIRSDTKASPEASANPPGQSYADPNRHCCYLCSRQFKSAAEVNKHERMSSLHQTNLNSEELVTKARAKLDKHGIPVPPQPDTTEYRDRAKERRKAFGVINKKGQPVQPAKSTSLENKPATNNADDDDDDEEEDAASAPITSKGASLLGKMGYVAGTGLGVSGTGVTAPIAQDVYVAGVGLGAQGGKLGNAVEEAERNTKGDYGGFLAKTRDGARERYERMNG